MGWVRIGFVGGVAILYRDFLSWNLTLWVEALDAAVDRRRQEALVAVFNKLALRCRGCAVTIRLRQRHDEKGC